MLSEADESLLSLVHCPLGLLAADEPTYLCASAAHHLQNVRIGLTNFTAKEFHDAERLAGEDHGETKCAVQAFFVGGGGSRKVTVFHNVGNPSGLASGPDATGKSDAKLEGATGRHGFEIWDADGGVGPEAG